MVNVEKIIGKVNPSLYASNGKALLKKYKTIENIPVNEVLPQPIIISFDESSVVLKTQSKRKELEGESKSEHKIIYDSSSEVLESIYFFILDLLTENGYKPDKLVDNFTSTPGGSHFSEIGMKATKMQEEAMKMMGSINTVLRSTLNIVYDLKEFKMRLEHYDNLRSKNEETKKSALLSLKQIWLDKVDIQKGNSSIKAMALGQAGFTTLLDAFLYANTLQQVKDIDLNERVKRILYPRVQEFNTWISESENELRKRYEIEKNYLKSQVSSLKLYSRWARPYLETANELSMEDRKRDASLIKMFNTVRFDLTLFAKNELKPSSFKALHKEGLLPSGEIKPKRKYYSCILVDFKFRGIPRQGAITGRSEISFKGYALNEDELRAMEKELGKEDLEEVLKLIKGATTESLDQIQKDVEEFLGEDKTEGKKEEKKEKKKFSFNILPEPIAEMFNIKDKDDEPKKEKKKDDEVYKIREDDRLEKEYLRPLAADTAASMAFTFFDVYKKAHRMPSYN